MMGFGTTDDLCNTGLGLGLGSFHAEQENCSQSDHLFQPIKKDKLTLKYDLLLPSLTLGPSEEVYRSITKKTDADLQPQASSLSAVSSFSNSSIKKEREFGIGEEVDVERISSRLSDEDEEGSPRKKLRLTKEQSVILEDNFKDHSTLNPVCLQSSTIFNIYLLCVYI
jgi:homeobox-leucine zipper protein